MSKIKIYDEDDSIVFILYMSGRIYAWTTEKKDRDGFLSQRDSSKFSCKKKVMKPLIFRKFMAEYKDEQIIELPLNVETDKYLLYGTYKEEAILNTKSDELIQKLEYISMFFSSDKFNQFTSYGTVPEDYLGALNILMNKIEKRREVSMCSLHLFYELFKDTF